MLIDDRDLAVPDVDEAIRCQSDENLAQRPAHEPDPERESGGEFQSRNRMGGQSLPKFGRR
jgi:hypothetical protein